MEQAYLMEGTLIGCKNNKMIIELSNINGNTIYDNINDKPLHIYDKNTDTHNLINNFIYECKLNDCDYVTTGYSTVYTSNIDKKIHFDRYCKSNSTFLIYDINLDYNIYKYFKNINVFCDDCYIECFFNIN
ncbi:unknown similar to AMEV034 [Choristoneura biennis entomopoxvirus]|uniref:Uncharacterized protein n=1 Tax=Choristoneura biennis entomopoxvirus TaxID=10288 RepID=A0A916KPI3_CBEPV|nr:unknown similar to AMEV034 [Choristoneura biennis entomopoxvirus]CCU55654.1 unknown similar to AMEV034 [Choristoneura biennis entomopoxvirus]